MGEYKDAYDKLSKMANKELIDEATFNQLILELILFNFS